MKKRLFSLSVICSAMLLSACDGDDGVNGTNGSNGENGKDGYNTVISTTDIAKGSEQCVFGGQMIQAGLDVNRNGVLDADEVDASLTVYQCNEAQGKLAANLIGRYESGVFGQSAAEIVDFYASSKQAFVVNAQSGMVDVLDLSKLSAAEQVENPFTLNNIDKLMTIDAAADSALTGLGSVNSVAVHGDLMAMAIERADSAGNSKQGNGVIAFYRLSDSAVPVFLKTVEAGALPDNVTFSPDGAYLLVANEGEPNDAYDVDPEGSVSIIAITDNTPADTATSVGFTEFNVGSPRNSELSDKIKINGPGASIAQDLEPEYVAVSQDSKYAFVSLQENNAIAVIDIANAEVVRINALGLKDYGLLGNEIDASDKDDMINIRTYQGVYGMYQPDTIASYQWGNTDFIVSANEGDSRDYSDFSEEVRAEDLTLSANHPQVAAAQDKTLLGRLKVTTSMGESETAGIYDKIVSYGARSFSIWTKEGTQVFDSGSQFEKITAALLGDDFNNHNEESKGDSRSDDKGPEPEAVALGKVGDALYAFIGLERTGGFMIYDVTNPFEVSFIDYVVNRDFDVEFEIDGADITGTPELAGDLGPEGMKFVDAMNSPTGLPLLIVGNEVSGSTAVYQFELN
ncbi:alkaline phosphatase [Shewanella sp. WXL01]|uniref:choice-of-anchor I family protein n=1 Tax=Shewanella sp. WXL01 TaxID=2709721 RepID=UPI0014385B0D|nr:choice-of-anchor I family protein [Shewanella sp. WXL01]NKF50551.1 alkaline phosphatase [Shewanella sp. WXL01]